MKTIHVRPHTRRVPVKHRILDNETSMKLWDEFVRKECVSALEANLKSYFTPAEIVRLRETY